MNASQFKKELSSAMIVSARSTVPVDTGNLRDNGVYMIDYGRKGFSIIWSKRFAYYMEYVDKGIYPTQTLKVKRNIGFVERGMKLALSQFYAPEHMFLPLGKNVGGGEPINVQQWNWLVYNYNKYQADKSKNIINCLPENAGEWRKWERFFESLSKSRGEGNRVFVNKRTPYIIWKKYPDMEEE